MVLLVSCANSQKRASTPYAYRSSSEVVAALVRGDYQNALALANEALTRQGENPWLLYDKGAALAGLNRVDEALDTLRRAEARFSYYDVRGRSIAVYRRGLVLEFAGRCGESAREFSHYAAMVRHSAPQLADAALAHPRYCVPPATPEELARRATPLAFPDQRSRLVEQASTQAAYALERMDYRAALSEAEKGLALAPHNPWLLYNRGAALSGLQRIDEAVDALRLAEQAFSADNIHGRSVAIYRRALALEGAGRCDEASREFQAYASLVKPEQPELADRALQHSKFCRLASAPRRTF
jgi:tetratricopeptide (TPR) repeat protein